MKQVYMCEGCEQCYNSEDHAEKCEEFHNTDKEDVKVLDIKFEKHSSKIGLVLIEYDRFLVGQIHKEQVWFHAEQNS